MYGNGKHNERVGSFKAKLPLRKANKVKVKLPLFLLVLVVFLSTMNAQNSSNMGVVVQRPDDNSGASVTTVHLLNISNKDPAPERPTASVVARLKAVLEDDQKKADTDNKAVIQRNGSAGEVQLESQIRNFARLVNRNQEAPLAEMLEHNKTELAKLAPHFHITEIQ